MITFESYKNYMTSAGSNLSEIRKNASDDVVNASFNGDVGYKRVYILSPDNGWEYVDAKYSKHATPSILRDAVDYYLQFRPKVHYPVGTYVFVPDDVDNELDIDLEHPLNGDTSNLWLIVGRNNSKQFVRYQILKCNWNFKWVHRVGKNVSVFNCWGCARSANSYTSGVWNDYYITALDNITSAWLPNTHYLFGDNLQEYNLSDVRTITIQTRMMISLNSINPNCFMVSKIADMSPKGLLKLTFKQDDYNKKRDDSILMICDYYDDSGEITIDYPTPIESETKTSRILVDDIAVDHVELHTGATTYFSVEFSDENVDAQWRISLVGDDPSKDEIEKLMVMNQINAALISIRPGKSSKVKGRTFTLSVYDADGNYYSSTELEVVD